MYNREIIEKLVDFISVKDGNMDTDNVDRRS